MGAHISDETKDALAKAIVAELPDAIFESIVADVIRDCIQRISWNNETVRKIIDDLIVSRARELVKTKYAAEIDKQADILAAKVVAEMSNFKPVPPRGY